MSCHRCCNRRECTIPFGPPGARGFQGIDGTGTQGIGGAQGAQGIGGAQGAVGFQGVAGSSTSTSGALQLAGCQGQEGQLIVCGSFPTLFQPGWSEGDIFIGDKYSAELHDNHVILTVNAPGIIRAIHFTPIVSEDIPIVRFGIHISSPVIIPPPPGGQVTIGNPMRVAHGTSADIVGLSFSAMMC